MTLFRITLDTAAGPLSWLAAGNTRHEAVRRVREATGIYSGSAVVREEP